MSSKHATLSSNRAFDVMVHLKTKAKRTGGDRYATADGTFVVYIPQDVSRPDSTEPQKDLRVIIERPNEAILVSSVGSVKRKSTSRITSKKRSATVAELSSEEEAVSSGTDSDEDVDDDGSMNEDDFGDDAELDDDEWQS